ncbi:MAG: hypothetical protein J6S67_24920 [Methanobrevibacter sp.]|nr:hypothetical protein [Methanobrevibacter sp.]
MGEVLYCIENQYGSVIAKDMNMDNAIIFVRALFDTYFGEDDIAYTITRQKEDKEIEK